MKICVVAPPNPFHTATWLDAMRAALPFTFDLVSPNVPIPQGYDLWHFLGAHHREEKIPKPFIFSIWNRREASEIVSLEKKLVTQADIITCANREILNEYGRLFNCREKLRVAKLQSYIIEELLTFPDRKEAKEMFNVSGFTVAIGYHGRRRQGHPSIVRAVTDFVKRTGATLMLHLHWQLKDDYLEEIKIALRDLPCKIITERLTPKELAMFRLACDVMINAQPRDHFSLAMVEHLLARSIVVNGDWHDYAELDENAYHEKVSKLSELDRKLQFIYDNYEPLFEKTEKNVTYVAENWSWGVVTQSWVNMYIPFWSRSLVGVPRYVSE